ncbi:MAG: ribonuclease HI [Chloroflexota bacterium]|nr:ribonuclease HI [Chloroflexota bacterium]
MNEEQLTVTIYSDGGAKPNPDGPGGWAALLLYGEHRKEISGGEPSTTNNRMELTAAIKALETLNRACSVEFVTDSEYLRKGITEWIKSWKKNNWRTSSKQPVMNQDLWMQLDILNAKHRISWRWTKGHAGNIHNERVDQLATAAREAIKRRR